MSNEIEINGLTMMVGTSGYADYLVIANTEGFKIGVKPVFDNNGVRTFVGMRVRLVPGGNCELSQIDMMGKMLSLYPNIPWQSKDHKRLSIVGGAVVGINHKNIQALHEWFTNDGVSSLLFKNLQGMFPNTDLILSPLFVDFYTEKFLEEFKLPVLTPQGDGNTVVNMFDFKKALYDDGSCESDTDYDGDNHEDDE